MSAVGAPVIYVLVVEAGELCARDHELGCCGAAAVEASCVAGAGTPATAPRAVVATKPKPSFPKPVWNEVLEVRGALPGAELVLTLLDADPLQPQLGPRSAAGCIGRGRRRFTFGVVRLRLDPSSMGRSERHPLVGAGSQGYLTFEISRIKPEAPAPAPASGGDAADGGPAALQPAWAGADFCGVLLVGSGDLPVPRCSFEVSAGPCAFTSWEATGQEGPRQLFLLERDPLLSVHADVPSRGSADTGRQAHGEVQLSRVEGPHGPVSLLLEPAPLPVQLRWKTPGDRERLRLHFRFFPVEFLRPTAPRGVSIRFSLVTCSNSLPLPMLLFVPAGVFADPDADTTGLDEIAFVLGQKGGSVEVCVPDAQRLIERSIWRFAPYADTHAEVAGQLAECLVDVLALRLRPGTERTITVPLGLHLMVLRVVLSALRVEAPRSVLGVPADPPAAAAAAGGTAAEPERGAPLLAAGGRITGVLVHALVVHSPVVSRCFLFGGPEGGAMFASLPHQSQRVFVGAEAAPSGRVLLHALLPEFGVSASAEALLGDGPSQVHWTFPTSSGSVLASALVTCVRWPSSSNGSSVQPLVLRILQDRVPEQLCANIAPVRLKLGPTGSGQAFEWLGPQWEGSADEALMPLRAADVDFGRLDIYCGPSARLRTSFFAPELLAAQRVAGARGAGLSLPVLVEADSDLPRACLASFAFLPVSLHCHEEAIGRPCPLSGSGVLLLQSFASCVTPSDEAHHQECPIRNLPEIHSELPWRPLPSLTLTIGGAQRTFDDVTARRTFGAVAAWQPKLHASGCIDLMPHIGSSPFDDSQGSAGVDIRVEFQLSCTRCRARLALVAAPRARPRSAELTAWESFCMHFDVHAPGSRLLRRGAVACARLMICTSMFTRAPDGLMSLTLESAVEELGIAEVLEWAGRRDIGDQEDPAAFVRLAVRCAGRAQQHAVTFDGVGASSAGRTLHVETAAGDLGSCATLEIQGSSGARRPLAAVCLAALGAFSEPLRSVAHPLFFGPQLALVIAARYEPSALGLPAPHHQGGVAGEAAEVAAQRVGGAAGGTHLAAEISRLRVLRPAQAPTAAVEATAAAAERRPRRSSTAPVASRVRPRSAGQQSHPFLDRGPHHWVAPRRASATTTDRFWSQDLDRQRPAPTRAAASHAGGGAPTDRKPPGWDDARESAEGPAYRQAFLSRHRAEVHELHEELKRSQVDMQREETCLIVAWVSGISGFCFWPFCFLL